MTKMEAISSRPVITAENNRIADAVKDSSAATSFVKVNDSRYGVQRIIAAPKATTDVFLNNKKEENKHRLMIDGISAGVLGITGAIFGRVSRGMNVHALLYGAGGAAMGLGGALFYNYFKKNNLNNQFIDSNINNVVERAPGATANITNAEYVPIGTVTVGPRDTDGNRTVKVMEFDEGIFQYKNYDSTEQEVNTLLQGSKDEVRRNKYMIMIPTATVIGGSIIGAALRKSLIPSFLGAVAGFGVGIVADLALLAKKHASPIVQFTDAKEQSNAPVISSES